jgi:RHS repeat-associated protein
VTYGNLESRRSAGETQFYHYNGLDSTDSLTDPTEVITDQYTLDAWGETVASSGTSPQPYQWIGRRGYYYDTDTGRHNLRRRDYESAIGRFLSEDPLGPDSGDGDLYRYVENSPVNATDPSGLQGCPTKASIQKMLAGVEGYVQSVESTNPPAFPGPTWKQRSRSGCA